MSLAPAAALSPAAAPVDDDNVQVVPTSPSDDIEEVPNPASPPYVLFDLTTSHSSDTSKVLASIKDVVTSVSITPGTTKIGKRCFKRCTQITSVNFLVDTVVELDEEVFCSSGVVNLSGMEAVKSMGETCFGSCTELVSIKGLGPDVREIPKRCFEKCSKLRTLQHLPPVTTIGEGAFAGTAVGTVKGWPLTVKSLGRGAFDGCTRLLPSTLLREGTCGGTVLAYMNAKARVQYRCARAGASEKSAERERNER
jgi:hypothetical protein